MAVDIPSSVLMSLEDHVSKMKNLVTKLENMEKFSTKISNSPSTMQRARASSQKMNMELKGQLFSILFSIQIL